MPSVANIAGCRYGNVTAVKVAGRDAFKRALWECICDCGATFVAGANNLKTGNTKSCGCKKRKPQRVDMVGARFGRLSVLHVDRAIGGRVHWLCMCDCGNFTSVLAQKLRRGTTKSCGCFQVESRYCFGKPLGPNKWRRIVTQDAGCAKCGSQDNLHAHHITPVSANEALSRDLSNGATLCGTCHTIFHARYGKSSATADDFCEYVGLGGYAKSALISFVGWRAKGGIEDLKKARHFIDLLIELEGG